LLTMKKLFGFLKSKKEENEIEESKHTEEDN
jgi:hypothetical protein